MTARQAETSYFSGKWGASDAAWCDLMDRAQSIAERADVVDAVLRCMRRCHTMVWPAAHWDVHQRRRWSVKSATAAFQASERSVAEATGLSRQRVRTFFRVAEKHGLIVKLADAASRGEGRGAVRAVYTFPCYVSDIAASAALTAKPVAAHKSGSIAEKFGRGGKEKS